MPCIICKRPVDRSIGKGPKGYWYCSYGCKKRASEIFAKDKCYVATAVYGSYDAPEVLTLRRFRDEVLAKSFFGRLFVKLYYFFSPTIAEKLKETGRMNNLVRKTLNKIVKRLNKE